MRTVTEKDAAEGFPALRDGVKPKSCPIHGTEMHQILFFRYFGDKEGYLSDQCSVCNEEMCGDIVREVAAKRGVLQPEAD